MYHKLSKNKIHNISLYKLMHTESFLVVLRVWEHANEVKGYDPSIWRKDFAGAWIRRDSYNCQSKYGWTIEAMTPLENGGRFLLDNLEAVHWQNALSKGKDYPVFITVLTSDGNNNIEKKRK